VSKQYQIDYTINRVDDDGHVTEIGFGGTGRWGSIREAAYEVESQLANDEWAHTSPEAAKGGGGK
jgi:hypothetical protein